MKHLKAGDKAPHFDAFDQDGNPVSLNDYQGKKLALFFYPQDNTEGCTKEVCNLRDNYSALRAQGYSLLGVSPDSARKPQNFIKKFSLPFPLLVDTERVVIEAYGVWGEKKMYGRSYMGIIRSHFIIDAEGKIEDVQFKVSPKNSISRSVAALAG